MLATFSANNETLQRLNQSVQYTKLDFAANSTTDDTQVSKQQSALVEVFTKSMERTEYDIIAIETVVLYNVPELSNGVNAKKQR